MSQNSASEPDASQASPSQVTPSEANAAQAVIDGIMAGQILETFDRYYAADVVMSENGADERVGFEACRAYEEAFVNGVEFHAASVGRTIIAGDQAAIEWIFEFTPEGGERVVQKQVALQTWRDGKVVREDFYHG